MSGDQKPECFGLSWDPRVPECHGGVNPTYNDGKGGHMQPQCGFFHSCGTKTQAAKMEQARKNAQQVIPPQALVRHDLPPALSGAQTFQQGINALAQRQQVAAPLAPTGQMYSAAQVQQILAQHQQAVVPIHFQQQAYQPMPVNYAMPGYLAVSEHRHKDDSIFTFGLRTIMRSMVKGGAHGLAHLVDVTPLKKSE